jgi:hypothetical protein
MSNKQIMRVRAGRRAADRALRRDNPPPKRTAEQQLARLDDRLGVGIGARRERDRLAGVKLPKGALAGKRTRTRRRSKDPKVAVSMSVFISEIMNER